MFGWKKTYSILKYEFLFSQTRGYSSYSGSDVFGNSWIFYKLKIKIFVCKRLFRKFLVIRLLLRYRNRMAGRTLGLGDPDQYRYN